MKYIAEVENILLDQKNNAHITLKVANYRQAHELSSLEFDGKVFSVDMKVRKSKRSIEQNNLLWGLLGLLEKNTDESMMNWYHKSLIDADAKPTYLLGNEDLFASLVSSFRAVKPIGKRMVKNNKNEEVEMIIYQCFVGSSKFNIKEMNKLIDVVLGYCAELGINTDLLNYE